MKHMKVLLSLCLALLCFALLPSVADAAGSYTAGTQDELTAAIASAQGDPGSTITLTGSFVGGYASITDGNFTIDFSGHTLTEFSFFIDGVSNIRFTDSSAAKNGGIAFGNIAVYSGSSITIDSGSYSSDYTLIMSEGGDITINGGIFSGDIFTYSDCEMLITGGDFDCGFMTCGNATFRGGTNRKTTVPTIILRDGTINFDMADPFTFHDELTIDPWIAGAWDTMVTLPDGYGFREHGNSNSAVSTFENSTYYNLDKVYEITFDYNDNSGKTESRYALQTWGTLASDDPDNGIPTPANTATHTFVGWFTEATGGTEIVSGTIFDKDTTVYAQWKAVPHPPVFTTPTADQQIMLNEGESTTITVEATNNPTYQWYVVRASSPADEAISGAMGASYSIPAATMENNGDIYYCVATNADGSVTSPIFTVTVFAPSTPPETGDGADLLLWAGLLLLGALGMASISGKKRRVN